jgi:cytochrome oxidase Cu insertion factor (SCO1/SenC/PrrC family)
MSLWNRKRWWLVTGSAAVGIALLSVLLTSLFGAGTSGPATTAPDITLTTTDGEFRLSDRRDHVLLLYFSFPG